MTLVITYKSNQLLNITSHFSLEVKEQGSLRITGIAPLPNMKTVSGYMAKVVKNIEFKFTS